ncbi:transmembrane protein 271 [Gracilinanus agilis]|uniref:transmembrane protein 271 n=1 Tax=Gracilinanus agilis TaxID=191870 RepID=UPI001CFE83AB|nr:transmembrane protein 271 [Gracilinanus agilis]
MVLFQNEHLLVCIKITFPSNRRCHLNLLAGPKRSPCSCSHFGASTQEGNYKSSQARRGRRGRRRGGRGGRPRGGPGSRQHAPASRQQRRGRRGKRGGRRLLQRPSEGSLFSPDEADLPSPGRSGGGCGGGCSGGPFPGARHAVSYINVGVFHAFDEAGVEVRCGGHPSVELPGYSPSDPDLQVSYPYCCRPPHEDVYPRDPGRAS